MWQSLKATDYLLVVIGFWLALLSIYLIKTVRHWRKITKGTKSQDLEQTLENIIAKKNIEAKQIQELSKAIAELESLQKGHFTKYALIRFNPFEDTGGDQSFAFALLDGANNGVVISSLHSRNGTRIYAKQVTNAKPTSHQFSKEEKEVVEKAARHVRVN